MVKKQFLILSAAVLWLIAACVSSGANGGPPVWLESPPEDTIVRTFWTGIHDGSENEEDARDSAVEQLLSSFFTEVGFRVDPLSFTGEARELYESYYTLFTNLCLNSEGDIPDGVTIIEEYSFHGSSGWIYAYLASADSSFIKKFSNDFIPYLRSSDSGLTAIIDKANRREELGDIYSAMILYGEAGAYVLDSDMAIKDYQYQEYAEKVLSLASDLELEITGGSPELLLGVEPEIPYIIKLGAEEKNIPFLNKANIRLEYPESREFGKVESRVHSLALDETGSAEFFLGSLLKDGEYMLSASLDPEPVVSAFGKPDEDKSRVLIERIRSQLSSINSRVNVSVKMDNKKISTAIVILDTDITEKPFVENNCERAVLEALAADSYDVYPSPLDSSELLERSDVGLLRDYKAQFGLEHERLIYGVASISDFESNDSAYMASTSIVIKVADVRTGAILSMQKVSKTVESQDNQQVIKLAFRELGREVAKTIAARYP